MKKVTIILLTFLYLLPAIGISINVHQCGKNKSYSFFDFKNNNKCKCGKKMNPRCCKDYSYSIKITDSQKLSRKATSPENNFTEILCNSLSLLHCSVLSQHELTIVTNYHSPPLQYKPPVYLFKRVFLI